MHEVYVAEGAGLVSVNELERTDVRVINSRGKQAWPVRVGTLPRYLRILASGPYQGGTPVL